MNFRVTTTHILSDYHLQNFKAVFDMRLKMAEMVNLYQSLLEDKLSK